MPEKIGIIERLKNLFGRVDNWIDEYGQPTYEFLQKLKTFFDNPELDAAVAFTHTKFDDHALEFLREKLAWAIDELGVLNDTGSNDGETIDNFVIHMRARKPMYRQAILVKLGSILLKGLVERGNSSPKSGIKLSPDTLMQLTWEKNQA